MASRRQNHFITIFIVVSLLLHAAVFGVASQYDFRVRPEPPEPEQPRTITLRRMEPPKPLEPPPPPPQQQPREQMVPTHEYMESEPNPDGRMIAARDTELMTRSVPTNPDAAMPEMKGNPDLLLANDYVDMDATPNAKKNQPGVSPQPQTSPEQTQGQEQQADAQERQEAKEGKNQEPTKEKPNESKVEEEFEKVEQPQDGKADRPTELAMKNPNELPPREPSPPREYAPDAMPLLPPEPRAEKARPLTRVEDPEQEKQQTANSRPQFSVTNTTRKFDIRGGGRQGDMDSPDARSTAEGRWIDKMLRTIRSRYNRYRPGLAGEDYQTGLMEVTVTVRQNGVVDAMQVTRDTSNGYNQLFGQLMFKSVRAAAPFDVFPSDMKRKYPDGFTFTLTIAFQK
ncbi:MAG: hypothetical protein AAGK14_05885 [Verrucomicrobiota bacterium]